MLFPCLKKGKLQRRLRIAITNQKLNNSFPVSTYAGSVGTEFSKNVPEPLYQHDGG
jgi:hypothetical protein